MHLQTGYMPVKVTIAKINVAKGRITFKVDDKDAEKLMSAINNDMARRHYAHER